MSFYTALTGLNAATSQLGVTSNNIANVGTTGFKRSRADFGDIFATSPLQKASSVVGQGVALKSVTQEFSQGNIQFSASSLDIAITGDGFFPLKSADGLQDIYTRNGTFLLDDSFAVVNSAGQSLMAASVDSSGKADLENLRKLIIPRATNGDARETTEIELGLNLPADGEVITKDFNPTDPTSYNLTTAVTVFDAGGNEYLATVYYVKTQRATPEAPENKWQTHVYIGDTKLDEFLVQASNDKSEALYVNKYGQVQPESAIPPQDIARGVTKLFNLDRLTNKVASESAGLPGQPLSDATITKMRGGNFDVFKEVGATGLAVFDLSSLVAAPNSSTVNLFRTSVTAGGATTTADITITASNSAAVRSMSIDDLEALAQAQMDAAFGDNAPTIRYSPALKTFLFEPAAGSTVQMASHTGATPNALFGLTAVAKPVNATTYSYGGEVIPNGGLPNGMAFTLNIDRSPTPVRVDVSDLYDSTAEPLTGVELARELQNRINKAYGDQRYFDFTSLKNAVTPTTIDLFTLKVGDSPDTSISLTGINDPASLTPEEIVELVQERLDAPSPTGFTTTLSTTTDANGVRTVVTVNNAPRFSYSPAQQRFLFEPSKITTTTVTPVQGPVTVTESIGTPDSASIKTYSASSPNELFGLSSIYTPIDDDTGSYGVTVVPNGASIRAYDGQYSDSDQRTGIRVTFDDTTGRFSIFSGTTGDESSVEILYPLAEGETDEVSGVRLTADTYAADDGIQAKAFRAFQSLFNFEPDLVDTEEIPTRGVRSLPATVTGTPIGLNLENKFTLSSETNKFTVTVDNVTGLIELPVGQEFTRDSFRELLESRINSLEDSRGRTVNGVRVTYESQGNATVLKITTGTEGDDSFLKVTGPSIWGLSDLPSGRGSTERWLTPPQAETSAGVPLYVDRDGNETTEAGDFSEEETRELWSPIFLDKGELTFTTAGNLLSPAVPIGFKPTTIGDTGATLQFSINYDGSTQFSSPFAVLAQDQNGRPEGDLIGLDIGDDGLVSANYSNGTQKNLAKVILANFTAPTGLRQIGDASYYATSQSGAVTLGEAGTAGFGTVRAGARERANVDLTQELIELITAQRNFQANAKAIETNNTLTQAIINIRS
ncbi:MAG: Flagellar hook protein FlgE [Pseudomonadota bacterium]|jgi:flagellar hook-basal body protein